MHKYAFVSESLKVKFVLVGVFKLACTLTALCMRSKPVLTQSCFIFCRLQLSRRFEVVLKRTPFQLSSLLLTMTLMLSRQVQSILELEMFHTKEAYSVYSNHLNTEHLNTGFI